MEDDAAAFKIRWQRREAVGGAEGGDGGFIERARAGLSAVDDFRDGSIVGNGEFDQDTATLAHARGFRVNGEPVSADRGEDSDEVRLEVYALGVALEFQGGAGAACTGRQIKAGAGGIEICRGIAHGLAGRAGAGYVANRILNRILGD